MKFTEISPYTFPSGNEIGFLTNMSNYDEKSDFVKLHEETILENEISLDAQVARDFNVKLGDIFTLNIYGKKIEGKVKNFRAVDYRDLSINLSLIHI